MLLQVQQEAGLEKPGDHPGHLLGADDVRVKFDAQLVDAGQRQVVQQFVFGAFNVDNQTVEGETLKQRCNGMAADGPFFVVFAGAVQRAADEMVAEEEVHFAVLGADDAAEDFGAGHAVVLEVLADLRNEAGICLDRNLYSWPLPADDRRNKAKTRAKLENRIAWFHQGADQVPFGFLVMLGINLLDDGR